MNLLECLGVGVAANNKELDTDEIFVYLPSKFPQQDGEVLASVEEVEVNNETTTGDITSSKMLEGNSVPAKWMKLNSNRITAPDVRVGSKVAIYQWKGKAEYYWTYVGVDGTFKLETIIYVLAASPNIDENTPLDSDNYYILLFSTHQKKLQLLTGKGNGEPAAWNITIDTGNAYIGIGDDLDNMTVINALEKSFSYQNADMSLFTVNKKDIGAYCKGNITFDATERIDMKCNNFLLECKTAAIKADDSLGLQTNSMTFKANSLNADIPNTNWKGNIKLDGMLHATEKLKTNKDIEFGNTSGSQHKHSGVRGGDSISGPPVGF